MNTKFEELPDHAKVWVYQANRTLNEEELNIIDDTLQTFISGWVAHGKDLKAGYKILYGRFIVLSVDEAYNMATGCSIDSSVAVIKELSSKLAVDFFDRTQIAFFNNGLVETISLNDLSEAGKSGRITAESVFFNNLISNIGEFNKNWKIKAEDSWLKRYLTKSVEA